VSNSTASRNHKYRALRWSAAVVGILAVSGLGIYYFTPPDVTSLLQNAKLETARGNHRESLKLAECVLAWEPDNVSALTVAGDTCFLLDDFDRALGYFRRVPVGDSPKAVHAQLRCGRIEMHHVGNAVAAESHFRTALRFVPDDRNALFQLASLLGIQARRNEAVPLILRLFRQGAFNRDLLALLEMQNTALYNVAELNRYRNASPDSPAILVGLAWHARLAKDDAKALGLLKRAKRGNPRFAEARVALATVLWDLGQYDTLRRLLAESQSLEIDETRLWVVRGKLAERDGQVRAAFRCFGEAFHRDQTQQVAAYKLLRFVTESKNHKSVDAFERRTEEIQSLREQTDYVASKEHTDLTPVRRLVEQLVNVGRLWEAWGWCQVALGAFPETRWAAVRSQSLHAQLQKAPLTLVCRPDTTLNLDLSELPLPKWEVGPTQRQQPLALAKSAVTFRDDAETAGLVFPYFNSPGSPGEGQRMYEWGGGGCAILDFDSDGWPDLYFTQGCRWPVKVDESEHIDRLFRNLGNGRFADVTSSAGLLENRFSAGVTVGDFDNDGFDDIYVANIGGNRLLHNNGDGTFDDCTDKAGVSDPRWSTSCVMADLNGDALPDIYSVNYLKGPSIFETVCKHDDGRPRTCLPFHFPAAQDQLYLNLGDGRFANVTESSGVDVPNGKGLGLVAADWEGNGKLSLFVANDTVSNFFLRNQGSQPDGTPTFQEQGVLMGIALNGEGKAESCMGVAIGDADEDGDLDVFVTNFLRETNTLYRSTTGLVFDDVTRKSGLADSSLAMLGFGTQFLDADLDGRLDLLVANGHIDDYSRYGRPYKMSAQFFWNMKSGRFAAQSADRVGPYFSRRLLGRSLARVDWNRDGREDAVVSHLDQPIALLTNTTQPSGRFVSIRLRGVRSSRDAVGTTVVVQTEKGTVSRQLTAGDGYQASNERVLVFGLSNAKQIVRIQIHWPAGTIDTFDGFDDTNREYLIVEGTGRALRLP